MSKPTIKRVKQYIDTNKPFGRNVVIKRVTFLGGHNHFNYQIETTVGRFVLRINNPKGPSAGELKDEYKILKLVARYGVSPKPTYSDFKSNFSPLFVEEFLLGRPYNKIRKLNLVQFAAVMNLISKIDAINFKLFGFTFRFKYDNYEANIKTWHRRLKGIATLGKRELVRSTVLAFRQVAKKAAGILRDNQIMLSKAPKRFIYNDIHGGNIIWLAKKRRALFIDWQKVSTGDPAFMPAVFALRFAPEGRGREKFFKKVLRNYKPARLIKNFERLFYLRILEREVSDMIWVVWANLKQSKPLPFKSSQNYDRYLRVKKLINDFTI